MNHTAARTRHEMIAEFVTEEGGGSTAVLTAARKFRVSTGTVRTACRRCGVVWSDERLKVTRTDIRELLLSGLSQTEVARRCKVTRQRVFAVYRRMVRTGAIKPKEKPCAAQPS